MFNVLPTTAPNLPCSKKNNFYIFIDQFVRNDILNETSITAITIKLKQAIFLEEGGWC